MSLTTIMNDDKTFLFYPNRADHTVLAEVKVAKGERMDAKRKAEIANEVGANWIVCVQGFHQKNGGSWGGSGNFFTYYVRLLDTNKFQLAHKTSRKDW